MIEVLVVIAIIAVIAALSIPATLYVREVARRSQCGNNLRQLGLALNQYESAHSVYPQGKNGVAYSVHTMILPFMEQQTVYNSINFNIPFSKAEDARSPNGSNMTALALPLNVFLCPSDFDPVGLGGTNYAVSSGYGDYSPTKLGIFCDRVFDRPGPLPYISSRDVQDGTANTLAVAEWVFGKDLGRDVLGAVFATPAFDRSSEYAAFVASCGAIDPNNARIKVAGKPAQWLISGLWETMMNSDLNINGNSCTNGDSVTDGAWTASSRHGAGVNALFADGHASFVRQTIALPTWRSLSTRSGNEVIDSTTY